MADLRNELTRLMSENGALTPQIVLEAARPVESPLHNRFEWDDQIAGEKYRLDQARNIIRSVKVVYQEASETEGPKSYRAYSSLPSNGASDRVYLPTEQILQNPLQKAMLVRTMRREMAALTARYQHLSEWAEVLDEARKQAM